MARKRPPIPSFQEAVVPFEQANLSLAEYLQLNRDVLAAYDYTCAVTRARFNAETAVSANLVVIPVHPVETGGLLGAANLLPLTPEAAQAFRDGDFTIGVDFELLVDLSRIDPALLRLLHHSGKLLLPKDRRFVPDAENLHYHRHTIFQAVGG
jgi:predicted restriction endonuclease